MPSRRDLLRTMSVLRLNKLYAQTAPHAPLDALLADWISRPKPTSTSPTATGKGISGGTTSREIAERCEVAYAGLVDRGGRA